MTNASEPELKDYGLIIRPQKPYQWVMGSKKATNKLGADAGEIRPSGDWSEGDSDKELQKKNGYETSGCTNFGTYLALIALAIIKKYGLFPKNCSERYSNIGTDTTEEGNDPWHVVETIAKDLGAIHETLLPFSDDIDTREEYFSPPKSSDDFKDLVKVGEQVLRHYEIEPEWVLPPRNTYTPRQKKERLQEALKRGTVCVSVRAWQKRGDTYVKDDGAPDTHWVWLRRYKDGFPEIRDQYEPFIKKLEKEYDFGIAIVYFMRENPDGVLPRERYGLILQLLKKVLSLLQILVSRIGLWK